MADPVRDEAERLVAAAVAAMSLAARGLGGATGARPLATGSPECCVCPVCRVIAAVRDADSDLTERLATGAGDLAAGVASLLRSLSGAGRTGTEPAGAPGPSEGDLFWESLRQRARGARDEDDPWHAATTTATATATDAVAATPATSPAPARPKAPMAKKAVKKAVPKAAPVPAAEPARGTAKKTTKTAVSKATKKAVKKATPPGEDG